jgi:hypothetical protein
MLEHGIKAKKTIDWSYVLGLMVIPPVILAFLFLIAGIQGLLRYNPAYFTPEIVERYSQPVSLIDDLENAIEKGDSKQMAVLRGTRQVPRGLKPLPDVHFTIFWDQEGKYWNYLFQDTSTYTRYMQHLKIVNGRYVVVPENLYYYIDSGLWKTFFFPLAIIWWLIVALFTLGMWVYRTMIKVRKEIYG